MAKQALDLLMAKLGAAGKFILLERSDADKVAAEKAAAEKAAADKAAAEKAAAEKDQKTRFDYFHQAEEMLMRDMGVTPLLYYNEMYLQSDKVKDSYHTADGIYHFEYADIAE